MPPIILTLLIVILISAVAIWLIRQIPPPVPEIFKSILICIVVVIGLTKVLALW